MFTIQDSDFKSFTLPRTASANPTDNDGVICDTIPYIRESIFEAAARVTGETELSHAQVASVSSVLGVADHEMSLALFDLLKSSPLFRQDKFQDVTRDQFVDLFVDARLGGWRDLAEQGLLRAKPFVIDYLDELRSSQRLFGIVTGMPYVIANESIRAALGIGDNDDFLPLNRERRVCCDDSRLEGRGKPDPRCYELGISHFVDNYAIAPEDMWAMEDRANGAVAALAATVTGHKLGHVFVIPDEHDPTPLPLWDKKGLLEAHLAKNPDDRSRLVFLRSLEDLTFVS